MIALRISRFAAMHCAACAVTLGLSGQAVEAKPHPDRVKRQLQSDNYSVILGVPSDYGRNAELEVGDGSGHGGTLGWLRFRPSEGGVNVLAFEFDDNLTSYQSKWPPDDPTVTVKCARLEPERYTALLHDLAIVGSATLKPVVRNEATMSSSDFWVYARVTTNHQIAFELNWAGYEGSGEEVNFAKPRAAVRLAREAVKELNFEAHTLTDEERAWVSAKFAHDWKKFLGRPFYWWVREEYIQLVGLVGDKAALSVLSGMLAADLPKDASGLRCVYYAINAATRLMEKDVREKAVAEMDIETTRHRVLDLIRNDK